MNNYLIRKCVVGIVILLFLVTSIFPSFGINVDKPFLIYNPNKVLDDWDINISFDPIYPNGENNWYISCVTLTIGYNNETIKNVYVGGEKYTEPIVFCKEGVNLIQITAEDWEGNFMDILTYEIAIDYTPPEIIGVIKPHEGGLVLSCSFSDNVSGNGRLKIYDGFSWWEFPSPPYEPLTYDWELLPPLSDLHSEIKIIGYDNAGNYKECNPFPKPRNIYIIGFIKRLMLNERYLEFNAKYIYTSNSGIVKSDYLEFVMDEYSGLIGRNFIFTRIWGWQVPSYN